MRKEKSNEQTKSQLEFSESLIALYTAFRDKVHAPKSVLYTSCGYDASPSRVFDNVTFVDLEKGNEGCIGALKAAGLRAIKSDIREYTPTELHDLLILLNPAIPSSFATPHISPGAFIISNNYHGNATELHEARDKFELWGSLDWVEKDRRKPDFRVAISRDLTHLFEPVANAKELERYRPDHFDFTVRIVDHFIKQGIIQGKINAPFEEKWATYREQMKERMPYKRIAELYIFTKR